MKCCARISTIVSITLSLIFLHPAYANGEDVHLGGIFFLLLGGLVFVGGLGVVLYFLFRSETDAAREDDTE